MKYELIAFDMDGTLVREESCWEKIHEHFGVQKEASKNLEAWKEGIIDYKEFMRRDVALWKPTPHISKIKDILSDYELPPKAPKIMKEIRKRNYDIAIISGGLTALAEMVAQELGITHVFANGLEVDKEGYLTGEGIQRVDPSSKGEVLKKLTRKLEIEPTQCISVGDSIYDTELFSMSGMGIAIGNGDSLDKTADVIIQDFENFDQILEYL